MYKKLSVKEKLQKFIDVSNKKHLQKYNYSKSEYKGWDIPICIICPIHGEFYQNWEKNNIIKILNKEILNENEQQ